MAKYTGHTITSDSALGSAVIQRSLRFNDDDSASLNRTPSSAGNRKTFTFSFWTKRGDLGGSNKHMFAIQIDSSNQFVIRFTNSDIIQIYDYQSASHQMIFDTDAVFEDVSAWYHIVVAVDTTQSTNTDRFKLYVNNSQVTSFSNSTYPSQNHDTLVNTTNAHYIGQKNSSLYFDGYLAEFHFVDGYQYDPSYFGFTDPVTNIWMPKRYEGIYGTNGYYLDFSDNSSTSTLGIDKSPNGNDFTLNNFATGDSVLDTPSNNFSTLRHHVTPPSSGASLSEGNLKHTSGTSGSARDLGRMGISTLLPTSGKWYAEVKLLTNTNQTAIGVGPYQVELLPTVTNTRYVFIYGDDGEKYVNTNGSESSATYGSSYTQNDIIGIYVDMDASTPLVSFSKNGQWANGSGSWNQSTPTSYITLGNTFFTEKTGGHLGIGFIVHSGSGPTSVSYQANFGQDSTFSGGNTAGGNSDDRGIGDFKYPVPSGALALCSKNLPLTAPSVIRPQRHFDTLLWTGNGSQNRVISGLEFAPDFVWMKARSTNAYYHQIHDTLRGTSAGVLFGNVSAVEDSTYALGSFNTDGFTVYKDANNDQQNANGVTMVAWCWKAGGKSNTFNVDDVGYANASAAGITDGSIALTSASVNREAGFSMVTYTGTGSTGTVGHGFTKTPKVVMTKSRSATGSFNYLDVVGNSTAEYGLFLNDNGGYTSYQGGTYWADTLPTSSVFTVNSNASTNASGVTYIAYCWTDIPGYSKMGIYRGNGNADGKFVDCGFRPAWLLIKRTNASRNWMLFDNKRDIDNPVQTFLEADQTSADATLNGGVLFLANGFKCITADTDVNANDTSGGDTYLYMAFAEEPGITPFDTFPNAR